MTGTEIIDQLTSRLDRLTKEQLDALLHMAMTMNDPPVLDSLPKEARESLERGIADAEAGRTRPMSEVFGDLDAKLKAQGA